MNEKKTKIAVCSSAHPYDDARIFHRQAHSLARHFDVTIFACAPFSDKTTEENIRIQGLPEWQKKSSRIKNLFLLMKKVLRSDADVFIFHDTVGMLLIPLVKLIKRKKIIYDIHENFHGFIQEKTWIPRPLRWLAAKGYMLAESVALWFTDMVWFAVQDIGDHYGHINRIPKLLVGNYPPLKQFNAVEKETVSPKNRFFFVGSIDADRSILQIIAGFDAFAKKEKSYQLLIGGVYYSEEFRNAVANAVDNSAAASRIILMDKIPYPEVPKYIAESKAGLAIYQPTYNFLRSMPNKLFEYLGMGIPVITSNFPNFQFVNSDTQCGVCVDPNDVNAIAEAMHFLAEDDRRRQQMGDNGKTLVEKKFNWEIAEKEIIQAIYKLVGQ